MKALQLQTTDGKLKIIIYQWTGLTKGWRVSILMIHIDPCNQPTTVGLHLLDESNIMTKRIVSMLSFLLLCVQLPSVLWLEDNQHLHKWEHTINDAKDRPHKTCLIQFAHWFFARNLKTKPKIRLLKTHACSGQLHAVVRHRHLTLSTALNCIYILYKKPKCKWPNNTWHHAFRKWLEFCVFPSFCFTQKSRLGRYRPTQCVKSK